MSEEKIWLLIPIITAVIGAVGNIIAALIKGRSDGEEDERETRGSIFKPGLTGFLIGLVVGGVLIAILFWFRDPAIVIDSFLYDDTIKFQETWETDITSTDGETKATIDTQTFAPNGNDHQSLKIETKIPCLSGEERYQQIQRYFKEGPQDWSLSDFLEIWVKGDGVNREPWGGELSIVLIDGDDEVWQSTRWFERKWGWTKIRIHLVGSDVGDPWKDREDFVIPTWETEDKDGNPKVVDQKLDTDQIKAIWIKSLTTREWACGEAEGAEGKEYPDFTIWVDHIVRR